MSARILAPAQHTPPKTRFHSFAGLSILPLPTTIDRGGWFVGGQIGANYQMDLLVLGIEAQASWADFKGSSACAAAAVPAAAVLPDANCSAKIDALGTAAARLGWAFDHLLIYGKGGAAWTNDSYQVLVSTPVTSFLFSTNLTRWGWMAGIGVEYAFTDNWTAKIEYNYMDLELRRSVQRLDRDHFSGQQYARATERREARRELPVRREPDFDQVARPVFAPHPCRSGSRNSAT